MYKILLLEFKHETNTFSHVLTGLQQFYDDRYYDAEQVIPLSKGTRCAIGGMLEVLLPRGDVRLVPVLATVADPAGPVRQEVIDHVYARVEEAFLKDAPFDAVLLALHGAMVTVCSDDGEGDLLSFLRQKIGPGVPLFTVLDLHSNITEKMLKNADVMVHYDNYPHTDMYERGMEAAQLLLDTLDEKIKPVMRCRKIPLLLPSIDTWSEPMKKYVDRLHAYEEDPRVLIASFSHGFFAADTPETGMSAIAVTDNDPALAESICGELAEGIWNDRAAFRLAATPLEEALEKAAANTAGLPVLIADITDNPGAGSSGDGTHLLRAMIDKGMENTAFALIVDPESVLRAEKAGVGNYVDLELGGKTYPDLMGPPIRCRAYVKLISDGRYRNRGEMFKGALFDLHKSAVVEIGDISVIIGTSKLQPNDPEIFYAHGIDPTEKRCIAVKSTVHFRRAYSELTSEYCCVELPGLFTQDIEGMPYKKVRRPIYPLDKETTLKDGKANVEIRS